MKKYCFIAVIAYLMAYAIVRSTYVEVWERDNHSYVLFPTVAVYYLFRPISIADAKLTGMRFHIGPHQS